MNHLKDALHLTHCFAELTVMYVREVSQRVGATVLDALDCWPEDDALDAAIPSSIGVEVDRAA